VPFALKARGDALRAVTSDQLSAVSSLAEADKLKTENWILPSIICREANLTILLVPFPIFFKLRLEQVSRSERTHARSDEAH